MKKRIMKIMKYFIICIFFHLIIGITFFEVGRYLRTISYIYSPYVVITSSIIGFIIWIIFGFNFIRIANIENEKAKSILIFISLLILFNAIDAYLVKTVSESYLNLYINKALIMPFSIISFIGPSHGVITFAMIIMFIVGYILNINRRR